MINLRYKSSEVGSTRDEATLLALARNGGAPFEQPSSIDFENLVANINARQLLVHIPWFWQHESVADFINKYVDSLDIDSLYDVIIKTEKKCEGRELHWMEVLNLFHLYGLCRTAGVDPPESELTSNSLSLSSLSAKNSALIVRGADAKDAIHNIELMQSDGICRVFAEYQLFYYGGIESVIDKLSEYVGTQKESVIPTTLYALIQTFHIDQSLAEELSSRILSKLSIQARKLLEK